MRRALDVGRRDAGRALAPLGRARGERRLELVEARRVVGEERPVGHAVADEDVQEREGECRVGARERLQVQVGALGGPGRDRVDHDDRARRLRQPVLVGVRRGRGGIRAPDEMPAVLVESIVGVEIGAADQASVTRLLGDLRRVRGWADSVEVAAAARLAELARVSASMFPERVAADAGRVSLIEASRGFERAKTVEIVPELGLVLNAGETSAGHVDVVTRALRDLDAEQRRQLAERGDVLARAAAMLPREEFAKTVRRELRQLAVDGMARLERQKRAARLRTWTDRDTGMWCLRGEFDPETGLILDRKLQTMVDSLFHDKTPATAPTDPVPNSSTCAPWLWRRCATATAASCVPRSPC